MKKILTSGAIAAMLVMGSVAFAQTDEQPAGDSTIASPTIASSTPKQPTFPIAELGGCDSKDACHTYCEDSSHHDACFAYAQSHGLMSKEKIAAAKIILGKKGPGGCDSADSCKAYCSDSSHQDECMKFAQDKKIIAEDKVALIKKLVDGQGPGACKSAEACRAYCQDPSHMSECRAFAQENGLGPRRMGSSTMPFLRKIGSSTKEMYGRMGSSTPQERRDMERMRMGSSTRPDIDRGDLPRKFSSTTAPGREMQRDMDLHGGSTTEGGVRPPNGELRKTLPPRPVAPNDNLGATLLKGFAKLIGF